MQAEIKAKIEEIQSKFNESVEIIAKERDKLRNLIDEAENIVYSIDEAEDLFEGALQQMEEAMDKLSQYV